MKAAEKNLFPASPPDESKITGIFYEKFLKLIPEIKTKLQELNAILVSEEITFPATDEPPFQEKIDGVVASCTKKNILKLQNSVDSILKTLSTSSQNLRLFKTHIAPIAVFFLLFTHSLPPKKNAAILNLVTKICAITIDNNLSGSRMYSLYQKAAYYLKFQKPLNVEKFLDLMEVITGFSCKDDLSLLMEIRLACNTSQLCQDIFLKQKNPQFLGIITTLLHRAVDIFNQKKGDFPNENYFATIYALLVTSNLEFLEIYLLPGISHGLNNSASSLIAYTHRFSLKNLPEKFPETARQLCLSKITELCKKNIPFQAPLLELAEIFIPKSASVSIPCDREVIKLAKSNDEAQRKKLQDSLKKMSQEREIMRDERDKFKISSRDLEEKLSLVENELKATRSENQQLSESVTHLQTTLAQKNQELESSRLEQAQLTARVQDLKTQINLDTEELKTAYQQIDKARTTVSDLQTSLFHTQGKVKRVSADRDRSQIASASLELRLSQSQAELKTSHKDYLQLLKINSRLEDKLHSYRKKLQISEDNFFKLNEKKKVCLSLQESEYDRQIKALKETINRQNQQIINLQTTVAHNPAFFQLNSTPPLPWPTTRYRSEGTIDYCSS